MKTIEIGSFEKNLDENNGNDAFCKLDWQVWEKKGFTVSIRLGAQ